MTQTKMNEIKLRSTHKEMLLRIQESMEHGSVPWQRPWEDGAYKQYNGVSQRAYTGMNELILSMAGAMYNYNDPRWYTYKQVQGLGPNNKIKKGSKGIKIGYATYVERGSTKSISFSEFKILSREEQEKYRFLYKEFAVFNGSQITNLAPYEEKLHKITFNETLAKEVTNHYLENENIELIMDNIAAYNFSRDVIKMPQQEKFKSEKGYYATLFHEMGHSTGNEKRLNRELTSLFAKEEYAIEELRAEMCSALLAVDTGLQYVNEDVEQHAAYLKGWLSFIKEQPDAFLEALNDATKARKYIIEKSDYLQLKEQHDQAEREEAFELVDVPLNYQAVLNKALLQAVNLCEKNFFVNRDALDLGTDEYYQFLNEIKDFSIPLIEDDKKYFVERIEELINYEIHNVGFETPDYFRGEFKGNLQVLYDKAEGILPQTFRLPSMSEDEEKEYGSVEKNKELLDEMKSKVPILDYAKSLGFTPIKEGNTWKLQEHSSCKIYPHNNSFFRYSQHVGGTVIDFIKHFEEVDTTEAIARLRKFYIKYNYENATPVETIKDEGRQFSTKSFSLPPEQKSNVWTIGKYLKSRGISEEVYGEWGHTKKLLYEDDKKNCVFVGYDKNNVARFATRRGTGETAFRGDVAGSEKKVGIFVDNNSRVLVINEAPIDTMSYQTILETVEKGMKDKFNYLSICGTSNAEACFNYHLIKREQSERIDKVIIALDNDEAGQQATKKLEDAIKLELPNCQIQIHYPKIGKDFNEDLQAIKKQQALVQIEPEQGMQCEMG